MKKFAYRVVGGDIVGDREEYFRWSKLNLKGKSLAPLILRFAWSAYIARHIHNYWRERNNRKFGKPHQSVTTVANQLVL